MNESIIDFTPLARRDISDRILSASNELYEAIKNVPLTNRKRFPTILRNNNFATILRLTNTHAFLEITGKLQARIDKDRVKSYRKIFTAESSGENAAIHIENRNIRISAMTIIAPHAFRIGRDTSMCAWDLRHRTDNFDKGELVNILYVVGFGESIRKEDAWLEFDSLIRITFKDWSDEE